MEKPCSLSMGVCLRDDGTALFKTSSLRELTAQVGGYTFKRKIPFAITLFKKEGGLIFDGRAIFKRLWY